MPKTENHPHRKEILTGFLLSVLLSVLLLFLTDILYRIPFQHAALPGMRVYNVKIPAIDDRIPVIPVFFFGYIWSYAYWFFAPFFILRTGKKKTWEFIITYAVTLLVCFLILYFFPTKIDRVAEGLWDPSLRGFFWELLHICYNVDGGKVSYNLLPSMHCANCILFYQGMRDDAVPRSFRTAALVSSVLVIVSTLLTKQHYFLDAVTGVLLPLLLRPAIRRIWKLLPPWVSPEAPDGK